MTVRRKELRYDLSNTPEEALVRKRAELKVLRARVLTLEDSKRFQGQARSEIRDVENQVAELERSLKQAEMRAR
ncbi:hypothetical protein A1D31_39330 [Bradyrhizobium liaoningense]|nr:hypothetical protein A1D31_39330 [Bradyrhizobium liaoningense]